MEEELQADMLSGLQAGRVSSKYAGRQEVRLAGVQVGKQAGRQASRQGCIHAAMLAGLQAGRQASSHASRDAGRQPHYQGCGQCCRQAGRQSCWQGCRQARRQGEPGRPWHSGAGKVDWVRRDGMLRGRSRGQRPDLRRWSDSASPPLPSRLASRPRPRPLAPSRATRFSGPDLTLLFSFSADSLLDIYHPRYLYLPFFCIQFAFFFTRFFILSLNYRYSNT